MAEVAARAPAVGHADARPSPRHEDDLHGWVAQQVDLLRAGRLGEIDAAGIAEELSDVGSHQYDELESALEVLLMHLSKWDHQPERRGRSWRLTIVEQRKRVERQLRRNPSLRPRLAEVVADAFDTGRLRAAREIGVEPEVLPAACPYDWDAIMLRPFPADGA